MKVIIKKTGRVMNVSNGHARNYLFPKGLAVPATAAALKDLEITEQQSAATVAMRDKEWNDLAQKIGTLTLSVSAKANTEGVLFGSLQESVILDTLRKSGVTIESSWLHSDEPIKHVGPSHVNIVFPNGVSATMNLIIHAE